MKFFSFFLKFNAFLLRTNFASRTSQLMLWSAHIRFADIVALLLLFPSKSCDFRGPRKAGLLFGEKEKLVDKRMFCYISKTERCLLCFDDAHLRVTQSLWLWLSLSVLKLFTYPLKLGGV